MMNTKKISHLFSYRLIIAILSGSLLLITFLGLLATKSYADSPTILTITPSQSPNNFDTTIVINGMNFQVMVDGTVVLTAPTVRLGNEILSLSSLMTTQTLTATIPWGLEEGVYPISVENADGTIATLTNAFTVTAGLGVWRTGGPYGGSVNNLEVDTNITSTLYANLDFMGLYKSDNNGDSWQNMFAGYVTDFVLKPDDPQTIYLSGNTSDGSKLLRSADGGETWHTIWDGQSSDLGVSPGDPDYLYLINGATITRSVDGGNTWSAAGELSPSSIPYDIHQSILAVHPVTPTIVYAGVSGEIYKTTDAGNHWTTAIANFGETWWNDLIIDPHNPERIYVSGWNGAEFFARSLDGGVNWETIIFDMNVSYATDIKFHPTISGTMYALTVAGIYSSTNAGASWDKYHETPGGWAFLLNTQTELPFLIGHNGKAIFRSDNGGIDWQVHNEGLPGVQPTDIASSPIDPRFVYLGADDAGGFVSNNNGQSWQAITLPEYTNAVAVDPYIPTVAYMGGQNNIYKTENNGQTWRVSALPGLAEQNNPHSIRINVIKIDTNAPQVIYAGAGTHDVIDGVEHGWLYQSLDAGTTWHEITVTFPISSVTDIVIDPTDSQVIYVSTGRRWVDSTDKGSGIIKSINGGDSWEFINEGLTAMNISKLAVNPDDPQILYAGANLPNFEQNGGLFKTIDGGVHWEQVMEWLRISGLAVDPIVTSTIYAGSYWAGLFSSTDAGDNWERVDGPLGHLSSLCLDVIDVQSRTVVYAGVSGGIVDTAARTLDMHQIVSDEDELFGSGVYQFTIDYRDQATSIFLPLILKN